MGFARWFHLAIGGAWNGYRVSLSRKGCWIYAKRGRRWGSTEWDWMVSNLGGFGLDLISEFECCFFLISCSVSGRTDISFRDWIVRYSIAQTVRKYTCLFCGGGVEGVSSREWFIVINFWNYESKSEVCPLRLTIGVFFQFWASFALYIKPHYGSQQVITSAIPLYLLECDNTEKKTYEHQVITSREFEINNFNSLRNG